MVENFPKSAVKHSKRKLIFLNFMNLSTILCPCQSVECHTFTFIAGNLFEQLRLLNKPGF